MDGYFDYAAATPVDPAVVAAMQPFLTEQFYNPSAEYTPARQVREQREAARARIAVVLGARPAEIVFTAGGTEANNLAIHGIMKQYPTATMVLSAIEHDSVLHAARHYEHQLCPVSPQGIVDVAALIKMINDDTVLVSVMYANNEVGTVQPLREISSQLEGVRRNRAERGVDLPLLFHSDAAQATNYLPIHVHRLGVDLLSLNGGKIYGPKQSGLLYVRGGVILKSIFDGGGQERGLRSGTENMAQIMGLATALELTKQRQPEEVKRLRELQQYLMHELTRRLPDAQINGTKKQRLPNNIHITIPGIDNERLVMLLDMAGCYVAVGSACSASNDEPSHVLRAMGMSEDAVRSSLRITLGRQTSREAVDHLIDELVAAVPKASVQ